MHKVVSLSILKTLFIFSQLNFNFLISFFWFFILFFVSSFFSGESYIFSQKLSRTYSTNLLSKSSPPKNLFDAVDITSKF